MKRVDKMGRFAIASTIALGAMVALSGSLSAVDPKQKCACPSHLTLKRACLMMYLNHREASPSGGRGISFSYIVVGAGSAGCVLANR